MRVAADIFEVLSFEARLAIFRLLAQSATEGMVAGDIARELGIAPSNLSFHLNAIARAGIVSVERQGRYQRYRANAARVKQAAAYLTECCGPTVPPPRRRLVD